MKTIVSLFLLLTATGAWAQTAVLGAPAELALDPPWRQAVLLEFPEEGPYRLEATGLGGEPVEALVERRSDDGTWKVMATNRSLRGGLEAVVDFVPVAGELWRVRPPQAVSKTVILRLKKSAFSALKDTLKRDLSLGPEVSLPLRKRLELPLGTGGPSLVAATGPQGGLWVGWLSADHSAAEVWDATSGRRLGTPLAAPRSDPWRSLELDARDGPLLVADRSQGREARAWNGTAWVVEAAPATRLLTTPQGTFRWQTTPSVQVWRSTAAGWLNLELPRDRMLDRLLMGSTEDGLYALLASSTGRERSLYLWRQQEGWTAMPPPPAQTPPRENQWSATSGAGSLFEVEGNETGLTLRQFDGSTWLAPLDLGALAPDSAVALALLPPSAWSKTGTLVVATSRVTVYDLP